MLVWSCACCASLILVSRLEPTWILYKPKYISFQTSSPLACVIYCSRLSRSGLSNVHRLLNLLLKLLLKLWPNCVVTSVKRVIIDHLSTFWSGRIFIFLSSAMEDINRKNYAASAVGIGKNTRNLWNKMFKMDEMELMAIARYVKRERTAFKVIPPEKL